MNKDGETDQEILTRIITNGLLNALSFWRIAKQVKDKPATLEILEQELKKLSKRL